jgi:hypothetical protein
MVWNVAQTIRGKLRDEKAMGDAVHDVAADRPLPPADASILTPALAAAQSGTAKWPR